MLNPQTLNRYSYVGNNPLRYTDPTGHVMWQGDGGVGGGNGNAGNCSGSACQGGGGGGGGGGNSGSGSGNDITPSPTNTPVATPPTVFGTVTPQPTSTAIPSYSTFPGQQCTSGNPCLNILIPSSTLTSVGAALPPGHGVVNNPSFLNSVYSASPLSVYLPTDLGPDLAVAAVYNSFLNGLPALGYPATSLDQIAGNIVTGAITVVRTEFNGVVNAGINTSNWIATTTTNLGEAVGAGLGGLGPTLPIFYLPNNPLQPAGPLTS